jgi:hypothetical protein
MFSMFPLLLILSYIVPDVVESEYTLIAFYCILQPTISRSPVTSVSTQCPPPVHNLLQAMPKGSATTPNYDPHGPCCETKGGF